MNNCFQYLASLKLVLFLAALNSAFWHFMPAFLSDTSTSSAILLNVIRGVLAFWAGWVVIARNISGLWGAAGGGAMVLFIDHPIITGTLFLASNEFLAFIGVLISFVMFVWVAMLFGVLGGVIGKRFSE